MNLPFNNTFARLPDSFYTRMAPDGLPDPHWVSIDPETARLLDLDPDSVRGETGLAAFSGNRVLDGSEPLAMVYAGHQFGGYSPRLGDGRGLLLGEVDTSTGHWDLHLKGAGLTPYARMGDGRAVLRSSIREYLCSIAMAGLGLPTTRALCVIGSPLPVYRETPETGATLLRIARTHVRFGHFEYFFYTDRLDDLRTLADYCLDRYFPEARDAEQPYPALLAAIVSRTASMIAQWQAWGFAHGVMNTDNMSILGETFDYGPFGFLDDYEPGFICNHSDDQGRYAFQQQPGIGLWNLNALAHALSPLIDAETLRRTLAEYEPQLQQAYARAMAMKTGLGLDEAEHRAVLGDFLTLLAAEKADYSRAFRALGDVALGDDRYRDDWRDRDAFDRWAQRYRDALDASGTTRDAAFRDRLHRANPRYILRNYLAQQAIEQARAGDFSEVERLAALLRDPFTEHPDSDAYAAAPPDWGKHLAISCSS